MNSFSYNSTVVFYDINKLILLFLSESVFEKNYYQLLLKVYINKSKSKNFIRSIL